MRVFPKLGLAFGIVLWVAAVPAAGLVGADEAGPEIKLDRASFAEIGRLRLDVAQMQLAAHSAPSRVSDAGSARLERRASRRAFMQSHLLPRMSEQLQRAPQIDFELWRDPGPAESNLYAWQAAAVRHYAERGAKKALEHFLLERPSLAGLVDRVESVRGPRAAQPDNTRSVKFHMGFSHGTPRAEVRYRVGIGSVRLGLSPDGSTRLDLHHGRFTHAHVRLDFDADTSQYNLSCRLTF